MSNLTMANPLETPVRTSPHGSAAAVVPPPLPAAAGAVAGPQTLDDLAALTADELQVIYARAATPTIAEVTGDLRGRMLAFNGLAPGLGLARGLLARFLRAFASWRWFPWRGKSFKALDAHNGEGINRVFGDRKPRRWFRFETRIGPSRAGNFDAFHLDYDNSGNPFFIRAIKDEIRRVAPGLYLGQAYLLTGQRARLVLFFGLALPASTGA